MLHPSLYFADYYELANRAERNTDPSQCTSTARTKKCPDRDFQRIVLSSGCVLFRLYPPANSQPQKPGAPASGPIAMARGQAASRWVTSQRVSLRGAPNASFEV